MKRLLLIVALGFALTSCALFGPLTPQTNPMQFDIQTSPGAVFGSSADITAFSSVPDGLCRYQDTTAGARRAIACKTPALVTVATTGRVVVRLLLLAP